MTAREYGRREYGRRNGCERGRRPTRGVSTSRSCGSTTSTSTSGRTTPSSTVCWGEPVAVRAVDGVSFDVHRGETLGLVGESGCGKSTTGETLLRLQEATDGRVEFEGRDVYDLGGDELNEFRREAQVVFQDPFSSLDPRMTVGEIVRQPSTFTTSTLTPNGANASATCSNASVSRPTSSTGTPRVLRRSTPADRHRSRARARAGVPRSRRADVGTRRLRAGPGAEPARRPPDGVRPDLPADQPRSLGHPSHLRPGRRHVPRRDRRDRPRRNHLRGTETPYTEALLESVPRATTAERDRDRETISGDVPSPAIHRAAAGFEPGVRW